MVVYAVCAYNGSRKCNAPQEVEMVQECTGVVQGAVVSLSRCSPGSSCESEQV